MKTFSYMKGIIYTFVLLISHSVFADWTDISNDIEITKSRPAFDRVNRVYFVHLDIKNTGDSALSGPFRILIDNSTIPVTRQSGNTESGIPFVDVTNESITANETIRVRVDFLAQRKALTFDAALQVDIVFPNLPPEISLSKEQFVNASDKVILAATTSDDGVIAAVLWTSESDDIQLADSATLNSYFIAPQLQESKRFAFTFVATDSKGEQTSGDAFVTVNKYEVESEKVSVDIVEVEGVELTSGKKEYLVSVEGRSVKADKNEPVIVDVSNGEPQVSALSTANGEPVLMSFSPVKDGGIELSVQTSADVFVMRSPRFFGVEILDYKEFITRVRHHSLYPELVRIITEYIAFSPCPMDASCNPTAARIAEKIAQGIDVIGLIKVGNE